MNRLKWHVHATLRSDLSHIGESSGIDTMLQLRNVRMPDGTCDEVFMYGGNALRGVLRDCVSLYVIERLGLPKDSIPEDQFRLLFEGGKLDGDGSGIWQALNAALGGKFAGGQGVDVNGVKAFAELCPFISFLGCSIGNLMPPGKFRVGDLIPVAEETAHLLPKSVATKAAGSWRQWITEFHRVRHDDTKDAGKAAYLKADGDLESKSQMRVTIQTMAAGSELYGRISCLPATNAEIGAFVAALSYWAQDPVLGGLSAIGKGLCDLYIANWDESPFITVEDDRLQLSEDAAFFLEAFDAAIDNQALNITTFLTHQHVKQSKKGKKDEDGGDE